MADEQHVYSGIIPPDFTPIGVGLHYVDTAAENTYISVNTTSSSDWHLVHGPVPSIEYDGVFSVVDASTVEYIIPDDADVVYLLISETDWEKTRNVYLPEIVNRSNPVLTLHTYSKRTTTVLEGNILTSSNAIAAGTDLIYSGNTAQLPSVSIFGSASRVSMGVAYASTNRWYFQSVDGGPTVVGS